MKVVNQHIADSYPMEWWSTRFAQAVGDLAAQLFWCFADLRETIFRMHDYREVRKQRNVSQGSLVRILENNFSGLKVTGF